MSQGRREGLSASQRRILPQREGACDASPGLRNPCALVDAPRPLGVASGAVCHGV